MYIYDSFSCFIECNVKMVLLSWIEGFGTLIYFKYFKGYLRRAQNLFFLGQFLLIHPLKEAICSSKMKYLFAKKSGWTSGLSKFETPLYSFPLGHDVANLFVKLCMHFTLNWNPFWRSIHIFMHILQNILQLFMLSLCEYFKNILCMKIRILLHKQFHSILALWAKFLI